MVAGHTLLKFFFRQMLDQLREHGAARVHSALFHPARQPGKVDFGHFQLKSFSLRPCVKGGVKGSQCGGVKVVQWKVMDLRGGWRLERSGRRHPPRSAFGGRLLGLGCQGLVAPRLRLLCFRRKLSPFISRMWTWWVSRSSRAPVRRSDPRTSVHSAKGKLLVSRVEPRS